MAKDEHAPDLAAAEFDAQVKRAGLVLTAVERKNVLATARCLYRAAAKVATYNAKAKVSIDDPA